MYRNQLLFIGIRSHLIDWPVYQMCVHNIIVNNKQCIILYEHSEQKAAVLKCLPKMSNFTFAGVDIADHYFWIPDLHLKWGIHTLMYWHSSLLTVPPVWLSCTWTRTTDVHAICMSNYTMIHDWLRAGKKRGFIEPEPWSTGNNVTFKSGLFFTKMCVSVWKSSRRSFFKS